MNGNFKGMDPDLAIKAMNMIKEKKQSLDTASRNATDVINEKIMGAFAGTQTDAMKSFVEQMNNALQNLYKYLDGSDSNFANTFDEVITSYKQSNENVAASFSTNSK